MKGLLIKDFKLMKNMRNSMLMILIIAVGMGSYMKDLSFIIVYLSLLGATFTNSTLSYDDFDNGYAFLFSLPVSRKGYVVEKYCLGLILSGGGWLAGTVIAAASGMIKNTVSLQDSVMTACAMLPVPLLLLAALLPFHLKFGAEKGRIVLIGIMGAVFVVVVLGEKIAEALQLDLDALIERMPPMGMGAAAAVVTGGALVVLLLSCRISIGLLNKKEY